MASHLLVIDLKAKIYDGPSVKEKIFTYLFSPPYFGGRK